MNFVVFAISGLIDRDCLANSRFYLMRIGIVVEEGVPLFVDSIMPSGDLFTVQIKSLLSFCFGHGLMNNRFIRIPNVVFR
jgi:hypothetical protein